MYSLITFRRFNFRTRGEYPKILNRRKFPDIRYVIKYYPPTRQHTMGPVTNQEVPFQNYIKQLTFKRVIIIVYHITVYYKLLNQY